MSNRVYVGPAEKKADVVELNAAAEVLPGTVAVRDGDEAAIAGAAVTGEHFFVGNQILGERDQPFAAGETAQLYRPRSGDYYALRLAASQEIAAGDGLTTNATGLLVALGVDEEAIVFADEDVTTTDSEGVIRVFVQ